MFSLFSSLLDGFFLPEFCYIITWAGGKGYLLWAYFPFNQVAFEIFNWIIINDFMKINTNEWSK